MADVQRAADAHITLDDSLAQVCLSYGLAVPCIIHRFCSACWDAGEPVDIVALQFIFRDVDLQFELRRRVVSRLPVPAEPIESASAGGEHDVQGLLQAPLSSHRKGFTDKQCK